MVELDKMVEIANPEQPHCPVVLVVDVSGSMESQGKIGQLNDGIGFFKEDVMKDDLARKRVDVAMVTFGSSAQCASDFSSIDEFEPATLQASGLTAMGEAIEIAMDMVEQRKQMYRDNGTDYYRPWIFLITDGAPTDMSPEDAKWTQVVSALHAGEKEKKYMFFAVGVEPADMETLRKLAPPQRPPVMLRPGKFKDMFQWLSRSQQKVSASRVGEQVALENPAGPDGWATVETV